MTEKELITDTIMVISFQDPTVLFTHKSVFFNIICEGLLEKTHVQLFHLPKCKD